MKRFVLLTTFLAISKAYALTSPFQGPYLNLGVGGTNANFNISQQVDILVPGSHPIIPNNINSYDNNVAGAIGVGYTQVINQHFILGVEATANTQNTVVNKDLNVDDPPNGFHLSSNTTTRLKNNFSLLVKPGFIVNQTTLMYVLLGPRWGNFESTTQVQSLFGTVEVPIPKTTRSGYKVGMTMGAGIEEYLGKGFSLGLEYAYTDYGNIPNLGSLSVPILSVGTLTNNTKKISAKTNTVLLNIFYRIA